MKNKIKLNKGFLLLPSICFPMLAVAQDAAVEKASSINYGSNFYLNIFLVAVAALLIPVIGVLGKTLIMTIKTEQKKSSNKSSIKGLVLILGLGLGGHSLLAASVAAPEVTALPTASDILPYLLGGTILFEALIILFMLFMINRVLAKNEVFSAADKKIKKPKKSWQKIWDKMNRFKPMDQESDLDTGHNYDGIRELNNITPPWFLVGFGLSIVFAIIYMWVYHVSESAPLQIEEYEIAIAKAELREAEYLKSQANNVDENNVVLLDQNGIEAGKALFVKNCAICHKEDGRGEVGPNLTDNYSLYGGSLREIFKSIKYGRENGMKSWKGDLSPVQISQLTSYIHKMQGTNVEGGKEPQGDPIVLEEGSPEEGEDVDADSTKMK